MPENNNSNDNSNNNGNGASSWGQWQRLVLAELERLDKNVGTLFKSLDALDSTIHKELSDKVSEIKETIADIKTSIAVLQTKSAVYGAIGGALFAGLIEFIVYSISGHK